MLIRCEAGGGRGRGEERGARSEGRKRPYIADLNLDKRASICSACTLVVWEQLEDGSAVDWLARRAEGHDPLPPSPTVCTVHP